MRVGVSFRGRSHGQGGDGEGDSDLVTVEEPMELRLDFRVGDGRTEQSIAVTMRTPGDDFDLALGFLLGEGVIAGAEDVASVEFCGPPSPDKGLHNTVKVTLADHVRFDAERLSRHVFTSSSCGVCGKATLDAVRAQIPAIQRQRFRIPAGTPYGSAARPAQDADGVHAHWRPARFRLLRRRGAHTQSA